MLLTLRNLAQRIWRGAWTPTHSRPHGARWWHYIDYWGWRGQDIVGALFIFAGPPWLGFVIYEKYSANPKATGVLIGLMCFLWILLVFFAYCKGRPTE